MPPESHSRDLDLLYLEITLYLLQEETVLELFIIFCSGLHIRGASQVYPYIFLVIFISQYGGWKYHHP